MDAHRIGIKLRELRGEKKAEEVARALGITPQAVYMYERGERIPRDEIKIRIATYFRRTVTEIFYENT